MTFRGRAAIVGIGEEALLAFFRSRLASYEAPKRLRFAKELPRNAAGKLRRQLLREEWSGQPSST